MQPVTGTPAPESAKATKHDKYIYVTLGLIFAGIVLVIIGLFPHSISSGVATTEKQEPISHNAAEKVKSVLPISPDPPANQEARGNDMDCPGRLVHYERNSVCYGTSQEGEKLLQLSRGEDLRAKKQAATAAQKVKSISPISPDSPANQEARQNDMDCPGRLVHYESNSVCYGTGQEGEKLLQLLRGEDLRAKKQAATPEKASGGR